jgi:hypothetical protein
MPQAAIFLNPISCLRAILRPVNRAVTRISSFEYRLLSSAPVSLKRFPIRRFLPTWRRMLPKSTHWESPVTQTRPEREREHSALTTGLSRASAGRLRTSPCSCSRARHTTSRWESQTSFSRKSATRLPAVFSTPRRRTQLNFTTTGNPKYSSHLRYRSVCQLHADAGTAHSCSPTRRQGEKGRAAFAKIGCIHCHTPSFTTGKMIASGSSTSPSAALSNQAANLYL